MLALLFPGQGAQTPGFLHRLPADAAVNETLAEASAALGEDVLALDTADALRSTVAVQVTIVTAGVALARMLDAHGLRPGAVAGLSVGAYAAAVACGAVAFADALRLVRRRAELMEGAYPRGYGMVATVGLTESDVEAIAAEQAARQQARVYIANVNARRQIVVAGDDASLAAFGARARDAGARKVERLAVSVPSHCELLDGAARELRALADQVSWSRPHAVYVDNVGGRPQRRPEAIRDDLATNLCHTVRWFDAVTVLIELGTRVFVEAPPGQTLTDILRDGFADMVAIAANGSEPGNLIASVRAHLARA
jgi:malonate decarboxylase epsilon subunit